MALALGAVALLFSYIPIGNATGVPGQLDVGLIMLGFALAPFAFVAVAFISRNPIAPKRVLQAMGLFIILGLPVGLLAPILGAAVGFGVGIALTLNPLGLDRLMRNRLVAVGFASVYTLVLLLIADPAAGVMTGALLPPMLVGLADEYTVWLATRSRS